MMGEILRNWKRLTPRQQEIVELRVDRPNDSHRETARTIGIAIGTYWYHWTKIKAILGHLIS